MKISTEALIKEYSKADKKGKLMLERIHGKEIFMPKILPLRERLTTFEDFCKEDGKNAKTLIAKWKKNGDTPDEIAYKQLKLMVRVLNGGRLVDLATNIKAIGYAPYHYGTSGSGFVFSNTNSGNTSTYTCVGSRLLCENDADARFLGTNFKDIWEAFKRA